MGTTGAGSTGFRALTPAGTRSTAEIVSEMRPLFPLVFGVEDEAEEKRYAEKHHALVDYASRAAAPILSAETVRYQTILLTLSLAFASVAFFRFNNVAVFNTVVGVDRSLLIVYAMFVVAIATLFAAKAFLDFERAKLLRTEGATAHAGVRRVIQLRSERKFIQNHFWSELANAIKDANNEANAAIAAAIGAEPPVAMLTIQYVDLDFDALAKIPELDAEVRRYRECLAVTRAQLRDAQVAFDLELRRIIELERTRPSYFGDDDPTTPRYSELVRAKDDTVRPWLDAWTTLTNDHFSFGTSDSRSYDRANDLLTTLERSWKIRRLYFWIEVVLPVLVAGAAIIYSGYR